jgi:uncharacterized phage protein (TIGR01671 family)
MQRELKFRVWSKEGKYFFDGDDIAIVGDDSFLTYDWHHDGGKSWGYENKGSYIIQQYADLKDKNGKEIYEGDIIKYSYQEIDGIHFKYFQVLWDDFFKSWALADDSGQPLSHTGWKFYNCDMGEVWGNIFENPELLKN